MLGELLHQKERSLCYLYLQQFRLLLENARSWDESKQGHRSILPFWYAKLLTRRRGNSPVRR